MSGFLVVISSFLLHLRQTKSYFLIDNQVLYPKNELFCIMIWQHTPKTIFFIILFAEIVFLVKMLKLEPPKSEKKEKIQG